MKTNSKLRWPNVNLLLLYLTITFLVVSCKKELITTEQYPPGYIEPKRTAIESINQATFMNELSLAAPEVGAIFESSKKSKFNITLKTDTGAPVLLTDQIKKIVTNGHTVYTIPLELKSPRSITFQNFIIDISDTSTVTSIMTYWPDQKYIANYKASKDAPFSGRATREIYQVSKGGFKQSRLADGRISQQEVCSTIGYITQVVNHPCASGEHTVNNPEGCVVGGPWTQIITTPNRVCWIVEVPGQGGGGGGTTNPGPPTGYEPCDAGITPAAAKNAFKTLGLPPCETVPVDPNEPYPVPFSHSQYLIATLPITDYAKQQFLINNPSFSEQFYTYLEIHGNGIESTDFVNSMIDYAIQNPDYTISEFANQFLRPDPGLDGEENSFNPSFWEDPNLVVQRQPLPSYNDFYNAYPKNKSSSQVYQLVGGSLYTSHVTDPANYSNACAIRVSRALLYSGINIPVYFDPVNGKQLTQKGGDNKNYFLRAADLNAWLRKTFDAPTYHFTKAQGGTSGKKFPELLKGKKGIFSMISDDLTWSTGHADVWNGKGCDPAAGCYFNGPVKHIDLWVLQ